MGLNGGFNEGDYLLTVDGFFFAVKGSVHPDDHVIAILRYIPDPDGDRDIGGLTYRRAYDIGETTEYLRENHPEYINHNKRLGVELQSVPLDTIITHFEPRARLTFILEDPKTEVENVLTEFVSTISDYSGIPTTSVGVSGSLLIGAQTENSDIDLNIYCQENSEKAYQALEKMRETLDWVKPLEGSIFDAVLHSRWGDTGLPLERFSEIENAKVLHGFIHGREYFVRLLVPDDEYVSRPVGIVNIKAEVTDASKFKFNPCVIRVRQVEGDLQVVELKSYRGKFTEQVQESDLVEARGTLEEVEGPDGVYHRLVLGGKGDYLLPVV